jgi:hypothetical protein
MIVYLRESIGMIPTEERDDPTYNSPNSESGLNHFKNRRKLDGDIVSFPIIRVIMPAASGMPKY